MFEDLVLGIMEEEGREDASEETDVEFVSKESELLNATNSTNCLQSLPKHSRWLLQVEFPSEGKLLFFIVCLT